MPPNISAMINVTDIFLFFVGTTCIKCSLKGRPKRSTGFRANLPRLLKPARAYAALRLLYLITNDAVYADVFIYTYGWCTNNAILVISPRFYVAVNVTFFFRFMQKYKGADFKGESLTSINYVNIVLHFTRRMTYNGSSFPLSSKWSPIQRNWT